MSTCANCKIEVDSKYDGVTSIFSIVDRRDKTTVLNVISELFGVSHKLGQFFQNYQDENGGEECVPRVCQRCIKILKDCFKWRKRFLNLCHPEGTLRSILFEDSSASGNSSVRSGCNPKSLKKCSVLVKRLPHVYGDHDPRPLLTVIKTEPVQVEFEDEYFGHSDNDYDQFCGDGESWSETEQPTNTIKPGTSRQNEHVVVDDGLSSRLTRSSRLRSQFKCRHCFKIFAVSSARDKHELVHKDHSSNSESEPEDISGSEEVEESESATEESDSDSKKEVSNRRKRKAGSMTTPPALHSSPRCRPPKVDSSVAEDDVSVMYEEIGRDTKEFICDKCDERFHFKAELTSHLVTCHDHEPKTPLLPSSEYEEETVMFKCPECEDFWSIYPLELTRHIFRIHTKENQYKCRKCPFQSADIVETRRHCVSHVMNLDMTPARNKPWTCAVCNVTLSNNVNIRRHISEHVRPLECPECDMSYGRTDTLNRHRRHFHDGQEPTDKEPQTRPSKMVLAKVPEREKKIRKTLDDPKYKIPTTSTFQCDKCEEVFSFQAHLLGHVVTKHLTDQRETAGKQWFKCTSCEFRNQRPSAITKHFFSHTKEKMYKCNFLGCNFASVRMQELNSHLKSKAHVRQKISFLEKNTRIDNKYQRIDEGQLSRVMCGQCQASFSFQAELFAHLVTYHSEGRQEGTDPTILKCNAPNCHFGTTFVYELTNHIFLTHTNEPRFKCLWSGCTFVSMGEVVIRRHVVAHFQQTSSSMDECVVCSERISSEEMLEKHMNLHICPYDCKFCGQLFGLSHQRRRHLRTHEGNIEDGIEDSWRIPSSKRHPCSVEGCGKEFPFEALLLAHSIIAHSGYKLKSRDHHTCNLCQQMRRTRKGLEMHLFLCHTKEKRFKCPTCGDTFVSICAAKDHNHKKTDKHHGRVSNRIPRIPATCLKFECTICSKRFLMKSGWKKHQVVHSKEQHFKCPVCSKSFGSKQGLRLHCRKVHKLALPLDMKKDVFRGKYVKILPVSTYKCEQCSEEFGFQAVLLAHQQIDHWMVTADRSTQTGFPCGLCSYVTITRQFLEVHYRRFHTKEMAFKCAYQNCNFAAVSSTQVRQHLKSAIHSVVPKLQCDHCGSFFAGKGCLDKHVKSKHSDETSIL